MISAFRRTLCGATSRCGRLISKTSPLTEASARLPLSISLFRMFSESSKKAKTKAAATGSAQSEPQTGEGAEVVEILVEPQNDAENRVKGGRIIENLGPIDQELPQLRNHESADILRTLDFTSRVAPILKRLKQLGLTESQITTMAARSPFSLVTRDEKQEGSLDVLNLAAFIETEYNLISETDFKRILVDCPEIFIKTKADLKISISQIASLFKLEKNHRDLLMAQCPWFLCGPLPHRLVLSSILVETLGMNSAQVTGFILQRGAVYLNTPAEKMQRMYLELFRHGYRDTELRDMFQRLPSLFTLSGGNFSETWKYLSTHIHEHLLKDVFFQNPILLSVDLAYFLVQKFHDIQKYGYSKEEVFDMFIRYPVAFARNKLKYLERRGRIEIRTDPAFPGILSFEYAKFIRARGEIMLKADEKNKRLTWAQVMELSDEKFCEHYKIPIEQLQKLQKSLAQSAELDIPYPEFLEASAPLLAPEVVIAAAEKKIVLKKAASRFVNKPKPVKRSDLKKRLATEVLELHSQNVAQLAAN